MTSHLDRWVIVAGAAVVLLLIGHQSYCVWSAKTVAVADIAEAQKLMQEANKNDLPPKLKDPAVQSERVKEAWEALPTGVQRLSPWNFFPTPPTQPRPFRPRRGGG